MPNIDYDLRDRLAILTDQALLEIVESKSEQFTPEALETIHIEVANRGGLEALKLKVEESRARQNISPGEKHIILKRSYPVIVLVAYGLFMYAINASLWFYWLCLFALIAALFAVLFKPPFNPEDEIKELSARIADDTGSPPPVADTGGGQEFQ
jgi:hypothetical protein